MAGALPVTVAELSDHETRAMTGDQPPSAVTDVQRARQRVVRAQLNTPPDSGSQLPPRRRRKRTLNQSSTFPARGQS